MTACACFSIDKTGTGCAGTVTLPFSGLFVLIVRSLLGLIHRFAVLPKAQKNGVRLPIATHLPSITWLLTSSIGRFVLSTRAGADFYRYRPTLVLSALVLATLLSRVIFKIDASRFGCDLACLIIPSLDLPSSLVLIAVLFDDETSIPAPILDASVLIVLTRLLILEKLMQDPTQPR